MSNNADNLTDRTLGTCILEKQIGQGGMGAVYLARQTRPSRYVAVKVLLPNVATNSSFSLATEDWFWLTSALHV